MQRQQPAATISYHPPNDFSRGTPYLYRLLYSRCPKLLSDEILNLTIAKEQWSTNRCQRRKAGLKCTDFCSCNDPEDDVSCDDDADDDHDGEKEEEEDEGEE